MLPADMLATAYSTTPLAYMHWSLPFIYLLHSNEYLFKFLMYAAHRITFEKAASLPIRRVVDLAARRYSKDMGDYLCELYERVKSGYNKYVEVIGGAIGAGACAAVKRGEKIYVISDEIPLLHFLTGMTHLMQGCIRGGGGEEGGCTGILPPHNYFQIYNKPVALLVKHSITL